MGNNARVLIAGTNSGCGKTTVTCALLATLVQRGHDVSSFKCGPDYIDPMFHSKIIGTSAYNLDPYFYDDDMLKQLLTENEKEISVIEGVMGFFDGMSVSTSEKSSYEVAKITKTPVILVINCKGMAYSVLPIIEGFVNHKTDYNLAGFVLNNITQTTYTAIKQLIDERFAGAVRLFGFLPKLPQDLIIDSMHLGLVTANEIADIKQKLTALGETCAKTLDIDSIVQVANTAQALSYEAICIEKIATGAKIAVAYDDAFCFYYKDNLKLLEKLGAQLLYFSPLDDKQLPDGANGLYLGGGYPELHLQKLSRNIAMRQSVLAFLQDKNPCIAECGGFMYLTKKIENYDMVGFLDGECVNLQKLSRFGYAEFTASKDCLLGDTGTAFKGHEFHYYDCTQNGEDFTAIKPNGKQWQAVTASEHLYAGYPHISFYSNIEVAKNFVRKCRDK